MGICLCIYIYIFTWVIFIVREKRGKQSSFEGLVMHSYFAFQAKVREKMTTRKEEKKYKTQRMMSFLLCLALPFFLSFIKQSERQNKPKLSKRVTGISCKKKASDQTHSEID